MSPAPPNRDPSHRWPGLHRAGWEEPLLGNLWGHCCGKNPAMSPHLPKFGLGGSCTEVGSTQGFYTMLLSHY